MPRKIPEIICRKISEITPGRITRTISEMICPMRSPEEISKKKAELVIPGAV